jgi:hypothetical protein
VPSGSAPDPTVYPSRTREALSVGKTDNAQDGDDRS